MTFQCNNSSNSYSWRDYQPGDSNALISHRPLATGLSHQMGGQLGINWGRRNIGHPVRSDKGRCAFQRRRPIMEKTRLLFFVYLERQRTKIARVRHEMFRPDFLCPLITNNPPPATALSWDDSWSIRNPFLIKNIGQKCQMFWNPKNVQSFGVPVINRTYICILSLILAFSRIICLHLNSNLRLLR